MKKTREEIEQIAEVMVDATKSSSEAADVAETLETSTWLPRELERHSHQGRHQAHGQ